MPRRRLPIGIQNFREIREEGCYYVDKTAYIRRMLDEGKHYFLSRPRRFGKSLFLDTCKELFEGNQALFGGLDIHDHWDWSVRHPVLRLSFGSGNFKTPGYVETNLMAQLDAVERRTDVSSGYATGPERFAHQLEGLHGRYGQPVAVLIDEYDKPILDALEEPKIARANRDYLRGLYATIKENDAHVRFIFLTGVSKFSRVGLFSGLNNLKDITMLLLFDSREFKAHWFKTGTSAFIVETLFQRRISSLALDDMLGSEESLSKFDVDHVATEALLFRTGYLTITGKRNLGGKILYRLGYPNREVKQSLNEHLLRAMGPDPSRQGSHDIGLYDLLLGNDFAGVEALFHAFFAGIPYEWYTHNDIARYEGYYASVFYSWFAALGLNVTVEDSSSHGRLDMAVRFNDSVYLFEFKVVEMAPGGAAMAQLKEKRYADKYRALGLPIYLIAVEFSKEARNLAAFDVERV